MTEPEIKLVDYVSHNVREQCDSFASMRSQFDKDAVPEPSLGAQKSVCQATTHQLFLFQQGFSAWNATSKDFTSALRKHAEEMLQTSDTLRSHAADIEQASRNLIQEADAMEERVRDLALLQSDVLVESTGFGAFSNPVRASQPSWD